MKHSSFKRLAVCLAIAAIPTIALCQTTTTTPSNQTGNNTPGQVFNGDAAPNGGTTGTFNGASPTGNNGTNAGTYNGHNRVGYEKALRACNDMKVEQQSACQGRVASKYGQSDQSNRTNTAMQKTVPTPIKVKQGDDMTNPTGTELKGEAGGGK